MKVIILFILVFYTSLFSFDLNLKQDIHLSVGIMDLESEDDTINSIGYGISNKFDNNIIIGSDIDIGFATFKEENMLEYSFEPKIGYSFFKKLNLLAICGYKYVDTESFNSDGYGMGIGIEYELQKHFSFETRYMYYKMTFESFNDITYDDSKLEFTLKYIF